MVVENKMCTKYNTWLQLYIIKYLKRNYIQIKIYTQSF